MAKKINPNPQDSTRRNVLASLARDLALGERIVRLEMRFKKMAAEMQSLRLRTEAVIGADPDRYRIVQRLARQRRVRLK